ncbi:hypothetical protein [Persephonella sp.]
MKKKKTYVFEEETVKQLEKIKRLTGKSETQILREAITIYGKILNEDRDGIESVKEITTRLEGVVDRLESLLSKLLKR